MNESIDQPVCKNCGAALRGKYCSNCGEKLYTRHDRKVITLVEEGVHFIIHLDGAFFNTLKAIFTRPGKLSTDYCAGIRKKYFKPISFFLMLVILYLLFPMFEGLNMHLEYYMRNNVYGNYTTEKIQALMQHRGETLLQLDEHFRAKAENTSKFLLLVIIPLSALFNWMISFKKRPLFYDQVIFATELSIVFLLWGYLLMPIVAILLYLVSIKLKDPYTGTLIYAGLLIYTVIASKKFYSFKKWQAALFAVVFTFVQAFVVLTIYKFVLFVLVSNMLD